jgi:mRNA interferase RelE/StbE
MKTVFKETFLKSILKIKDKKLKQEITSVIAAAEAAEDLKSIPNLKKLHGPGKYFRIKIKEYRIGLKLTGDILYFVDIAHRKDIYKHFP